MVITDQDGKLAHSEGRVWSFGHTVRIVSRAEAERASGIKIKGRH